MQIPRLFEEDIVKLQLQREAWVERNERILEAREKLEIDNDSRFIRDDMKKQIQSVKRNIRILNDYKELPNQLYEYIHARDQYISEVYDLTDELVTRLT